MRRLPGVDDHHLGVRRQRDLSRGHGGEVDEQRVARATAGAHQGIHRADREPVRRSASWQRRATLDGRPSDAEDVGQRHAERRARGESRADREVDSMCRLPGPGRTSATIAATSRAHAGSNDAIGGSPVGRR